MEKSGLLFDKSVIFRQIPLFAELNPFERKLIFDSLEVVEIKKSQMIYRQSDPPDAFYCIITGRVEIFISRDGAEETLEYIHRGKYFGFISLLTGEAHSVSARAVNDTVLAKIPKEDFALVLKSIPRLAIDLSAMLSRRLKRKDLHPKSIFESTIIAVYADEQIAYENYLYGLNLSLGLRRETQKKVILIDTVSKDSCIADCLQINPSSGFFASQPFFNSEEALKKIIRHPHSEGLDVLRIFSDEKHRLTSSFLTSLLTMLVNDYHYCVIPLHSGFGREVFKAVTQADAVHLLSASDPASLKKIGFMLEECGAWSDAELKKKIKLVVLEEKKIHGKGPKLFRQEEAALFHQPVYATLPSLEERKPFIIDQAYADPYSKTIRRISRQLGEILVGLALGSGSAMGMAHIGVLKVLEEEGIPVDIVSGSSVGALIGALWCSGYTATEIEEIILENKDKKYLFGLDDLTFPLHGLMKGKHIHRFLKKYLSDMTFRDIKRAFKVVACDCMSMRQVVFDSGKLTDAVMASVAIPGVFEPYKIANHYYIDGGILNPLPTNVLVEAGAKRIISVNTLPSSDEIERTNELLSARRHDVESRRSFLAKAMAGFKNKFSDILRPNIFDVLVSTVQSFEYLLAKSSALSQSDVALHPDMTAVSWSAFQETSDIIKRGEEEARLHLKEIKDLLSQSD